MVEDDRDIRETLRDALELLGHAVAVAADGREALSVLAAMERPCLILLDLMMPIMSGPEFLNALRADQARADIPVVIVSAWGAQATKFDAQGYLQKPVDLDELVRYADRYCGAKSPTRAPTTN